MMIWKRRSRGSSGFGAMRNGVRIATGKGVFMRVAITRMTIAYMIYNE